METPRWIQKEEECLFCHRFTPVTDVTPSEDKQCLLVSYVCTNPHCGSIKTLGYPNTYRMRYEGEGFVKQWEEGQKNGWRQPVAAEA